MRTSEKRKEDQPSSSKGKRQKTFAPRVFQRRGRGYQDQGKTGASTQPGQMICYFCHQPRHMRRHFLRGKDLRVLGRRSPSHQWDKHECSLFLLTPVLARGISISLRVLHRCLLLHI